MPEMDGISLVREVRKTKAARELPILIIIAKGEDEARDQGLALGANAYVLKPLSGKELFDLARKLLETAPAVEVLSAAIVRRPARPPAVGHLFTPEEEMAVDKRVQTVAAAVRALNAARRRLSCP